MSPVVRAYTSLLIIDLAGNAELQLETVKCLNHRTWSEQRQL